MGRDDDVGLERTIGEHSAGGVLDGGSLGDRSLFDDRPRLQSFQDASICFLGGERLKGGLERIKALDRETVKREIGSLLEAGALSALFQRRDSIVKTFESLARKNGDAQVFLP